MFLVYCPSPYLIDECELIEVVYRCLYLDPAKVWVEGAIDDYDSWEGGAD